ncbi:hypothetical protein K458DRAFT_393613 [Lentithecium fluviatile CBS 122367]|uniref:Uncharacterized protein n=1 Tax=Lentithecium fluviatile CBS 122367 TaxID=1168545 RepID=A0A6G1IP61_9PLEO|nr:hypothetical protein K458DRAFT_393613 [Lentithecium fluviatile CBS 122367]
MTESFNGRKREFRDFLDQVVKDSSTLDYDDIQTKSSPSSPPVVPASDMVESSHTGQDTLRTRASQRIEKTVTVGPVKITYKMPRSSTKLCYKSSILLSPDAQLEFKIPGVAVKATLVEMAKDPEAYNFLRPDFTSTPRGITISKIRYFIIVRTYPSHMVGTPLRSHGHKGLTAIPQEMRHQYLAVRDAKTRDIPHQSPHPRALNAENMHFMPDVKNGLGNLKHTYVNVLEEWLISYTDNLFLVRYLGEPEFLEYKRVCAACNAKQQAAPLPQRRSRKRSVKDLAPPPVPPFTTPMSRRIEHLLNNSTSMPTPPTQRARNASTKSTHVPKIGNSLATLNSGLNNQYLNSQYGTNLSNIRSQSHGKNDSWGSFPAPFQ